MNQSVGAYTDLLVEGNDNVVELDYGCGPSSASAPGTDRSEVYGNDENLEDEEANDESDEEGNDESDEDGDDESNGNIDVQADGHLSSFHTLNQVLENEQGYMSLWMQKLVMYQITQMSRSYVGSCLVSYHSLMLSNDPLSPYGGYVTGYPPQHLTHMRSL